MCVHLIDKVLCNEIWERHRQQTSVSTPAISCLQQFNNICLIREAYYVHSQYGTNDHLPLTCVVRLTDFLVCGNCSTSDLINRLIRTRYTMMVYYTLHHQRILYYFVCYWVVVLHFTLLWMNGVPLKCMQFATGQLSKHRPTRPIAAENLYVELFPYL